MNEARNLCLRGLRILADAFSGPDEYVAVFGSSVAGTRPRDIDVAIRTADVDEAMRLIATLDTGLPILRVQVNEYKDRIVPGDGLENECLEGFDIVLLSTDHSEMVFRSQSRLHAQPALWDELFS